MFLCQIWIFTVVVFFLWTAAKMLAVAVLRQQRQEWRHREMPESQGVESRHIYNNHHDTSWYRTFLQSIATSKRYFWTLVSGVATSSPRQLRWKRSWKYLNVSCFALFVLEQNQKRNDPPLSTQDNNSLICSTDRLWCEVLFRTFKLLYWQLGLIGVCVMRLVSDLNPLMMLTRSIADT